MSFSLKLSAWLLAALPLAAHAEAPQPIPLPPVQSSTVLGETTQGEIRFASHTPYDFDVLLEHFDAAPATTSVGTLFLPHGASAEEPVAAMVVLPGSGGIKPGREMAYGEMLKNAGHAALVVDYYRSRGVAESVPYALKTINVTEYDVVTDAYAALRALGEHPAVDASRVGVMGMSYGGMAARLAMDSRVRAVLGDDLSPFAAHVDVYGPCFQDYRIARTTGAPLLTLRGGEDASNDLVACARREGSLREAGSEVAAVVFAGAGHAWENLEPRHENASAYVQGCEMVFDDRGLPSVNGQALIGPELARDRKTRFSQRLKSGEPFADCVKRGYIVGRDEAVKRASDRELLRFIDKTLAPTTS
ncbi:dienelactone hydrolase family protein [Halomonas sp. CS7]|uniref:Dienelactone hydrolase family protein n=1 Tax=Halomonas pelophila TaxID=3151122 RepID=A0ABV1N606_9GAMM